MLCPGILTQNTEKYLGVVTAALLIGYASRNWDEIELEPVDDLVRFAILYATMIVDLVCIGLTIHLNLQPKKE